MNPTKKMTLALGLLLAGATLAQTPPTPGNPDSGLLGQRYAEFGLGLHDLKRPGANVHSAGVSANLPVVPALLDVGANYSYDWNRGPALGDRNTFGACATAYAPLNGAKPFVGLGLGWQSRRHGTEDQGIWNGTVGVEIPAGDFTLTPRMKIVGDFEDSSVSSQQWSWTLDGNYWVTPKTGVFASIGRTEVLHSPTRAWDYQIGVRAKF